MANHVKDFLVELNQNPIWQVLKAQILEVQLPKFNPDDPKRDTQTQSDRWKYMSGRQDENDRICKLLGIKE